MSIVKIRALQPTAPAKILLHMAQRTELKYAAARLKNVLDVGGMHPSVEGAEFWSDVLNRLRQIAFDGELV